MHWRDASYASSVLDMSLLLAAFATPAYVQLADRPLVSYAPALYLQHVCDWTKMLDVCREMCCGNFSFGVYRGHAESLSDMWTTRKQFTGLFRSRISVALSHQVHTYLSHHVEEH